MKTLTFLFAIAMLANLQPRSAMSDELAIPVLGHPWFVTVDLPSLEIVQGRRQGESYQFQGVGQDGFTVSLFVEPPATPGERHEDCYSHYWPKMRRNPLIDLESVAVDKTDQFVKVSYEYKGIAEELPIHHFNYYIAHQGSWIDIHLSMTTEGIQNRVAETFSKSLQFRGLVKAADGARNTEKVEK